MTKNVVATALWISPLFSWALAAAQPLRAPANAPRCESVYIEPAGNWREMVRPLVEASDMRLKQPLVFRLIGSEVEENLPVSAAAFSRARFVVQTHPEETSLPAGARVVTRLEFGYDLNIFKRGNPGHEFRRIGPVAYMVIDAQGRVLEVGGGSHEVLEELRAHLFGREFSREDLARIAELNRRLIRDLRNTPEARQRLKEFARKRGWPEGLEDEAQLAYFSKDVFSLRDWAARNGYTDVDMRNAGWLQPHFSRNGTLSYLINVSDAIRIPFFTDATETAISVWRSRAMKPKPGSPKYRSWQLDRAVEREFTVPETLYNGWKLGQVAGKTVVITEGEFKCLVATKATGVVNVGIPGITQFTPEMGRALIASQAKEIVIILDRDPRGKGLMRVDGVTDSERAAYSIARELQSLGANNVKVGVLPDVFEGGKVGIDDLILAKGVEPYLQTIREASEPDTYAKRLGLDRTLNDLYLRVQNLARAHKEIQRSQARGGPAVDPAHIDRVIEGLHEADRAYRAYLSKVYHGARTINEPVPEYPHVHMTDQIPPETRLKVQTGDGQSVPGEAFLGNILVMDFVPTDVSTDICGAGPCNSWKMSRQEISQILSGSLGSIELERGKKVAEKAGFQPRTTEDWTQVLLAGRLVRDFPLDDYDFDFNVSFSSQNGSPSVAPIMISKAGEGTVVALARARLSDQNAPMTKPLFKRIWTMLRPGRQAAP